MLRPLILLLLGASSMLPAQAPQTNASPFAKLDFLLGTWSAKTTSQGSAGAASSGTYTFQRDLAGHAIQRTSSTDVCKGPQSFNCQHHDQLTIFSDGQSPHGSGLYALFLDSEGHVIYYATTTPDPYTVVFQSQSAPNSPHFRLTYHLEGSGPQAVMSGKFQFAPPVSDEYHSYLEWSGTKQ